jgi:hypothetical protein
MAKQRNSKQRKSNKSIKKTKKHRQSKKSYRGGGCGCNNNNDHVMKGGYGPSNLPDSNHYYGLTNPTDLAFPQSSRIISGGKKNNKNRKSKKMHGGQNYIEFTGTTSGAVLGSNLIDGIPNTYSSITDGPLLNISSAYNA